MSTYHDFLTEAESERLANIIVDVADMLRARKALNAEAEAIRRLARNRMGRAQTRQIRQRAEADRQAVDARWSEILSERRA